MDVPVWSSLNRDTRVVVPKVEVPGLWFLSRGVRVVVLKWRYKGGGPLIEVQGWFSLNGGCS